MDLPLSMNTLRPEELDAYRSHIKTALMSRFSLSETEVDDIVGEAVYRFLLSKDQVQQAESWLFIVSIRIAHDAIRKQQRHPQLSFTEEIEVREADTEEGITRRLALEACLGRLTAGEREVIRLRLTEKRSWAEVAKTLDTTVGSARNDYERARRRLRNCLEAAGFPE
jgi:RNA polymerase sigma factor (sigma-70 family)